MRYTNRRRISRLVHDTTAVATWGGSVPDLHPTSCALRALRIELLRWTGKYWDESMMHVEILRVRGVKESMTMWWQKRKDCQGGVFFGSGAASQMVDDDRKRVWLIVGRRYS